MHRFIPLVVLSLISCDFTTSKDLIEQCSSVCTQVDSCSASPPAINIGGSVGTSGNAGVDCAANCVQEDMRAYYGYSDCQITCILEAGCDEVNSCWEVESERYATYCLSDRETTPVAPDEDDPQPSNGTTTGSAEADDIVDNPAVEVAVEESADEGFVINYGDTPPEINGSYHATGTIDESSNARPVGTEINTYLCYWDPAPSSDGTMINYCENGVPGTATAPITGSGDAFTIYLEYEGQATIMFSGTVDADGNPTNVEALVVYLSGVDVWELSHTNWEYVGTCDSCE